MNSSYSSASPAAVPLSEIERIVEQGLVVGADVERHRDAPPRMDTCRRGVHGELADRDLHAVHSPIADPQDLLGVGDHQQIDIFGSQTEGLERRPDVLGAVDREIHAPWAAVLMAVELDGLADGRVVHNR